MNARADLPGLVTESYLIPSRDPGIELYMRNKRPAGMTSFPADKILLYVHGATYPSETAFDLPIEGASMMDLIAARGYDVYLVDIRGYGRSTRPPEMALPPEASKPIVTTEIAVRDFGTAVDHVLARRGVADGGPSMTNTNPPRWSELALHVILKRRDRESIAGDLLEEYREEILPSRGPVRGQACISRKS